MRWSSATWPPSDRLAGRRPDLVWLTRLREAFERLRPELVTFRDEPDASSSTCPMRHGPTPRPRRPPRFLPEYDNLLLSHDDRSRVADRTDLADRLGWKGSVLVDGFVQGAWRIRRNAKPATLTVELFGRFPPTVRTEIEREAERLTAFAATGFGALELRFAEG